MVLKRIDTDINDEQTHYEYAAQGLTPTVANARRIINAIIKQF